MSPLESVEINLNHQKIYLEDCQSCKTKIDQIERHISIAGPLDEQQIQRLLEIADRCPVHRTLENEVSITTHLNPRKSN